MTFFTWGSETSHAMFRPLHHGPTVNIGDGDKINMNGLDIDQEVNDFITQRLAELSDDNHA